MTYADEFAAILNELHTQLDRADAALMQRDPGMMALRLAQIEALSAGALKIYGALAREALDEIVGSDHKPSDPDAEREADHEPAGEDQP